MEGHGPEDQNSTNAELQIYAFYHLLCVLCVEGFIFRNQGPLQKVCCDADTHAKPLHDAITGKLQDGAGRKNFEQVHEARGDCRPHGRPSGPAAVAWGPLGVPRWSVAV
jgi:hypothetical protein